MVLLHLFLNLVNGYRTLFFGPVFFWKKSDIKTLMKEVSRCNINNTKGIEGKDILTCISQDEFVGCNTDNSANTGVHMTYDVPFHNQIICLKLIGFSVYSDQINSASVF